MNKVVLIGRTTKEPELKYTPNGNAVTSFTIAIDRRFSKEKKTDFINIVVWGKSAENTCKYVSKGKLIGIAGRIETRSYDHTDGSKRYVTEVVADEVEFIEFADMGETNNKGFEDMVPVDDSDIPF